LGVTVPATVIVPAGASSATFPIRTFPQTPLGQATITAGVGSLLTGTTTGSVSDGTSNTIAIGQTSTQASAQLTIVAAPILQSISTSPASLAGGDAVAVILKFGTGTLADG